MPARHGGADRISTKARLANELAILGRVLADARENAKIKQSDLAAKLGVPASYLSKIENGTRRLDVVEFVRIVEAMDLDPAEVVHELRDQLHGA